MEAGNYHPKTIFLVSGKRKSGKDYVSELLLKRIGIENAIIVRLSAPIKSHWAKNNNLEFDELLGTSDYKEKYRKAMIDWSDSIRNNDYGYFCRAAIEVAKGAERKQVWIISDARRKTDLKWFYENYGNISVIITVRIEANDDVRKTRGWIFEKGVDDAESECGLDSIDNWDLVISNCGDESSFDEQFQKLIKIYDDVTTAQ